MRKKIKWVAAILFAAGSICFGRSGSEGVKKAYAEELASTLVYGGVDTDEKTKETIVNFSKEQYHHYAEDTTESYEVELASDAQFTNPKRYETTENPVKIAKEEFGKDGGKLYFRVRHCVKPASAAAVTGEWMTARELAYIKISKKNFPGLYQLLKKGGEAMNFEGDYRKEIYDKNADGWLDPEEIQSLTSLSTENHLKKKKGKYTRIPTAKVSSLQGVEYLTNLHDISLVHYSGKKMDLRKNTIIWIDLRGITSKQFTLLAPDAKTVHVEPAIENKMKKMDLSSCVSAVDLSAYGNFATKNVKLPKANKKLKILSVSDIGLKKLNLNKYKNLQQIYVYNCPVKKVKVNKCKKLRYVYFFYCNKIKSLNLSASKKMVGIDLYRSTSLSKRKIKVKKGTKITLNQGKWWYETTSYKNDMNKIYK